MVISDADVDSVVGHLRDALAEFAALDPDAIGDAAMSELVMANQQLRGAFEAADAQVLDAWDRRKVWRADGAKTGAAWLAARQHLPVAETRRRLRHAREVRNYPAIAAAWAAGEIDRCHVITLLGACTTRTEAAFGYEHGQLVDAARSK